MDKIITEYLWNDVEHLLDTGKWGRHNRLKNLSDSSNKWYFLIVVFSLLEFVTNFS